MGRKRSIDRASLLTAIETVILRDGVAGLSIDAVAQQAGISKSSVVYDVRNKAGLLAAFTRSRMSAHMERLGALREKMTAPDRSLRAAIRLSQKTPSQEETAVAMMLAAAAHTTEECHNVMRQRFDEFVSQVEADAADLRATRLAFVALQGLSCMECFDFHHFEPDVRQQILQDISDLIESHDTAEAGIETTETSPDE